MRLVQFYYVYFADSAEKRIEEDIQRIPLFHDLILNNDKWVIFPIWWWL